VSKTARKKVVRRKYQIRNKLWFFRPHTLRVASKPKYARSTSALNLPAKFDKFSVLINPINTEKANKAMTERNIITFLIHPRANKIQVKKAFNDIYQIKPKAVNTLVTPQGTKKAYIRLRPENEAVGFASKLGII
jgi:large subunit ribosomal protein L23Ae